MGRPMRRLGIAQSQLDERFLGCIACWGPFRIRADDLADHKLHMEVRFLRLGSRCGPSNPTHPRHP